ncbi:MAG: hypothetical protein U0X20_22975 [Caldilineaceae bacterium]
MPIRIDEMTANVPAQQTAPPAAEPATDVPAGSAAQQDELRRKLRKLEQRSARLKAD